MAIYLAGLGSAAEGAARSLYAWWNGLQFTPIQWVGLVLGGIGALLLVGSRLIPSESAKDRRAAAKAEKQAASNGHPASPGLPATSTSAPASRPAPAAAPPAAGGESEFDEISELLRKRGIN
ncbi:hypothetical protein C1706_09140 [Propioniciclava flava]|uniref:Cellulose synthase n=2 Tax=Propioniciclava flava TaxID=2072026 RepID=A0A4Q2EFB2_9ACTN|nr:hypothetical protein C1706_09140 [Propioniciclava flava]